MGGMVYTGLGHAPRYLALVWVMRMRMQMWMRVKRVGMTA
jgi:hypothetical protein